MAMQQLIAELSHLRRRIRAMLISQALMRLIAITGLSILVIGVLDYFVHFPGYARLVWMSFLAAWCVKFIYTQVYKPASAPISLDQLALGLPSVTPEMRDQLASSLHFAEQGGGRIPATLAQGRRRFRGITET